jgi:hypothetical protein
VAAREVRDALAIGPRNAIDQFEKETLCPEPLTCEVALETTALAAMPLFAHDQTTERTVRTVSRRQSAATSDLNPT